MKNIFERAGFTKKNYEVTALVLAVIVTTSSDANTKLKCARALKSLRRLRAIALVKGKTKCRRKKPRPKSRKRRRS
jgi:hypothetical protein